MNVKVGNKDAFAELTDSSYDQIETHEKDWMRKNNGNSLLVKRGGERDES